MIPLETALQITKLYGGDAKTERMVLNWCQQKWGVSNLLRLSEKQADAIIARPDAFLNACEELWRDNIPF